MVSRPRESDGPFTRYVRLVTRTDTSNSELEQAFEDMWVALRGALASRLRRFSLWSSPPTYLGIMEGSQWVDRSGQGTFGRDALDILAHEAYLYVFDSRVASLRNIVADIDRDALDRDIDGNVRLHLQNFVSDRQKKHDPLGYRIFTALSNQLQVLIDHGHLWLATPGERIRNNTILSFGRDSASLLATPRQLKSIVEEWTASLMPDLMMATGAGLKPVYERLRKFLRDLSHHDVTAFRFGDLINALKFEIRGWMAALHDASGPETVLSGDGELRELIRIVHPDHRLEETDSFEKLTNCVGRALENWTGSQARKRNLEILWYYLRDFASNDPRRTPPPASRLARELGIHRNSIPRLYETLQGFVQGCREKLSSWPTGTKGDLDG